MELTAAPRGRNGRLEQKAVWRARMKLTRREKMTLSLAHGAAGRSGGGQIVALLVAAFLAGTSLRMQVDLGLVVSAFCLMGVLSVLERRQVHGLFRRLHEAEDAGTREAPAVTAL
jgi:hypothetical protein